MYFKISAIFSFLILLCSCGGGGGGNSTVTPSLDLEGTWVSNCYLDGINEYTVDDFVFSGNTVSASYKTWDNSSCSGIPIDSDGGSGTFTVGKTMTTSSGLEAVEVDFNIIFNGQTFTVLDIITRNGNEFNYGIFNGLNTRPTELNFDVILTKQEI